VSIKITTIFDTGGTSHVYTEGDLAKAAVAIADAQKEIYALRIRQTSDSLAIADLHSKLAVAEAKAANPLYVAVHPIEAAAPAGTIIGEVTLDIPAIIRERDEARAEVHRLQNEAIRDAKTIDQLRHSERALEDQRDKSREACSIEREQCEKLRNEIRRLRSNIQQATCALGGAK
jgi:hypothetical protein